MKYRAIKDNAGRFAVNLMCSALEVSTSGYYAWLSRPESARAHANRRLVDRIREAHRPSRRCYGSPRITEELRAEGHCVGENRVARLMRASQIRAKSARKWRATTKSSHRLPVAENTFNRAFNMTQPDRVWATVDLTVSVSAETPQPGLRIAPARAACGFPGFQICLRGSI